MKKILFISLLSVSLLASQFGLNIYLVYCCCSKNLSYSLLPADDACFKKETRIPCCNFKSKNCEVELAKIPCGNKAIDYKTLELKAEKPQVHEYLTVNNDCTESTFSQWMIINKLSFLNFPDYFPEPSTATGWQLRKVFCSLTC